MSYAAGQPLLWPCPPDWSSPVQETLAFLTDVMQATTGGAQARCLRAAPRRGFSFSATVAGDDRRIADAFAFDDGVQAIALPIYPDVQWLLDAVDSGTDTIECATAGFDFVVGGSVVLWRGSNTWETGTVSAINVGSIVLTAPLAGAWPVGTRLYPLRRARLLDAPKAKHRSDEVAAVDVACAIDEPCDWPAAFPTATTYRSQPVLEWRNEESEDPQDQYNRLSGTVDMDTGPVYYYDLPGMPFRAQSQRFQLVGRAQHTAFRSLLYALAGRAAQLWVPSWEADLHVTQAITASTKQITVSWCGYTRFGYQQRNRRDIAIELADGTRLYRRIIGSTENGTTENLQLDSALGQAVTPAQIRQIGWLTLSTLASDAVTIQHATDAEGVAVCSTQWQAAKSDV